MSVCFKSFTLPTSPPPSHSVIKGGKTPLETHRFGRSWCGEQEEMIAIVSTHAVRISAHGRSPSVHRAAMCGMRCVCVWGGGTGLAGVIEKSPDS